MATMRIAANSASKAEGNTGTTLFTFTVTRSASVGTASANWSIVHGTTDSADFSGLTSGIVSFANGQLTRTITVSVVGNTLAEASEAFSVLLSNPTNATLTTASASSVIANDDLPRLRIVASATSLNEGTTTTGSTTPYTFTVTRDVGIGTSTVGWAITNRTTTALDFSGTTSGSLSFAAGETTKTITIQVAADATVEANEVFDVVLSRPTGAVIATGTARATLVNDDLHTLSIAATTASKNEGNTGTTPFTFTVTRSAGIGSSTVNWSIVHGTTNAADFSGATSGSVTFASGQTSKVITVYTLGDTVFENSEAFSVNLSSPSGSTLGTASATATIRNDDRAGIDGTAALVTNIVVPTSVDDSIDNLVDTTKWGGAIGTGVQLTYSFSTASSVFTYASGSEVPFTSLNANQKSAAVMAMNALSAICGVTFVEVADTATSAGDIRWTQSINTALSTAHAYYPSSWAGGGDVWIGPGSSYTNPVVGGYSYHTFIHELGHSMGLDHPHQGSPVPALGEDQLRYSVMSYRDNPSASTTGGYSSSHYPTDYMLNDVLALQYLYGVNTTTNQGDTVYQWAASSPVYDCIWDVGGNDTIDASNQTGACAINLNGGTWSTIGTTYYNGAAQVNNSLSIAYEVTGVAGVSNLIENAIGSAQADTLIGNTQANVLTGKGGADTLTGGGGSDVFRFVTLAEGGDMVTDFTSGSDRIEVVSPNFATLPTGTLAASRFVTGTAPTGTSAVFLYDSSTGQLRFDADGTGAGSATLIATMATGFRTLVASDIQIASV